MTQQNNSNIEKPKAIAQPANFLPKNTHILQAILFSIFNQIL